MPATKFDPFELHSPDLMSPAEHHYAIVPSDTLNLPVQPRAIFVNGAGTAVLVDKDGIEISYTLNAGMLISMRPIAVRALGTTASLVAWY